MRNLMIAGLLTTSLSVLALDNPNPSYDPLTGKLKLPKVEVNGLVTYQNVILKVNANSTFSVESMELPSPTDTPTPTDTNPGSTTRTYPFKASAKFNNQCVGNYFWLDDNSFWGVAGGPDFYCTGSDFTDLTIYKTLESMSNPARGKRADLFMLLDGKNYVFYIKELPKPELVLKAKSNFTNQCVGNLLILNNGAFWELTGGPDFYCIGSGEQNYTIYKALEEIPDPQRGKRSSYMMFIEGSNHVYFIKPL